MRTLFLNPTTWDLELDASGNIAVAESVYQQAQDISTAGRTFVGDLYYDATAGIPYFEDILGTKGFPTSLYKSYIEQAALSVHGVVSANMSIQSVSDRNLIGTISFTNEDGQQGQISL